MDKLTMNDYIRGVGGVLNSESYAATQPVYTIHNDNNMTLVQDGTDKEGHKVTLCRVMTYSGRMIRRVIVIDGAEAVRIEYDDRGNPHIV